MNDAIWRAALAVISGFGLAATTAAAQPPEFESTLEQEVLPPELQGQWEQWQGQGELRGQVEPQGQGDQRDPPDQRHPPRGDRDRNRDHDDSPGLLQVPGLSADESAREGLRTHERLPIPWVDPGPATDVDAQIDAVDQLMGVVARDLDGHDYCGLGCGGSIRTYSRGQNPKLYYTTCARNRKRCKDNCEDCGCAVYNSPKGGTKRSYYREGTKNGKIQLESAKEANGHDWYCYCVED